MDNREVAIAFLKINPHLVGSCAKMLKNEYGMRPSEALQLVASITQEEIDAYQNAHTVASNPFQAGAKTELFCPNCGKKISAESKFCMYCGENLNKYK